ncbi:MAG TPA: hypothetical protein VEX68_31200 [Bryobacteraceae bacterium]|nr:hypothetical protein [Bryobacteraceae bacterium]
MPPGTTGARNVQTVPTGVPAVGVPVGVPGAQPGAAPISVQSPSGGPPPPQTVPPQMPPGVPTPGAPAGGGARTVPSISSPATPAAINNTPATPSKPTCEVTLRTGRLELAAAGGEFFAPATLYPAACPSSVAFTVPWLKLKDQNKLLFVAEPNTTADTRETLIVIGDRSIFVRQAHSQQPGLAAAPSRLIFAVDKEGRAEKKDFAAWSELTSETFTVSAGHPWLLVTPKKSTQDRHIYEVTIQTKSGLTPGRYDSNIQIVTAGGKRSLTIPVVVEVEGVFR